MSNTTTSNQLQKEYNTVKKGITSREQANADIQRAQSLKAANFRGKINNLLR